MRRNKPASAESGSLSNQFAIHSVNAYSHVMLESMARHFELDPAVIGRLVQGMHAQVAEELALKGVDYYSLRWALQPRPSHREVAFIFDSTATETGGYGLDVAKAWIPALRDHGPKTTAISEGDVSGDLPSQLLWSLLDDRLVRTRDFPRMHPTGYFAVYLTNLTAAQLTGMDDAIRRSSSAYLGYFDCSTWSPFKWALHLPQRALRSKDTMVSAADEDGNPYAADYPFEEAGFRVVGVNADLYGVLLDHKIDNGVPLWADADSAIGLSVLGGEYGALSAVSLVVDESRIEYLEREHGSSVHRAGLSGLDSERFADAVKSKIGAGLIFNLRSIEGTRNGVRAPENDAMMFTVQAEFPDDEGTVRRYLVGLKYRPATHTCEVATFF